MNAETLKKLWDWLQGKKTYAAATGLFVMAFVALLEEKPSRAVEYFLAGMATLGLRSAVAKAVQLKEQDTATNAVAEVAKPTPAPVKETGADKPA